MVSAASLGNATSKERGKDVPFLKRGFQTRSFALEFCNIFGIRQMSSQKNLVRSVSCTFGQVILILHQLRRCN